jgi:hypothetical protein
MVDFRDFKLTVIPNGSRIPSSGNFEAFLWEDAWDDWFKYSTMYVLTVYGQDAQRHDIGPVKIGQFGFQLNQRRPNIPNSFHTLDDQFFSVGQDDSYYEKLNLLGSPLRNHILQSMRDCAADAERFERALQESVMTVSLLRFVTATSVRGQFRRLAAGGARLTSYDFKYELQSGGHTTSPTLSLDFGVKPDVQPPTNIHVLIGRNGVGKTHIMYRMTRALVEPTSLASDVGAFSSSDAKKRDDLFSSLVLVSFSAFDALGPIAQDPPEQSAVRHSYVGLQTLEPNGSMSGTKTPEMLGDDFVQSLLICSRGAKRDRWIRALHLLESDPIFNESDIVNLLEGDRVVAADAQRIYSLLSSGHKIILLTMTKLVETVEERTLVLIDEPEAHLHPPLLSAFVRALSDLLVDRNGVAIIATHSPVVLQEVPRACAWKLRRSGREVRAERPEIETFGESVGILTREVFGLEVTQSGFHRLLEQSANKNQDFNALVEDFRGELGAEARAVAQAIVASRNRGSSEKS